MIYVIFLRESNHQRLSPIAGLQQQIGGYVRFIHLVYRGTGTGECRFLWSRRSYDEYVIDPDLDAGSRCNRILDALVGTGTDPDRDYMMLLTDVPRDREELLQWLGSMIHEISGNENESPDIILGKTVCGSTSLDPIVIESREVIRSPGVYKDLSCSINATAIRLATLKACGGFSEDPKLEGYDMDLFQRINKIGRNRVRLIQNPITVPAGTN